MALSGEVQKRIDEWTEPPYSNECIEDIKSLINDGNEKELNERFGAELNFGTGGIRGILGFGTNRMNEYIIAKTTQGLANYVKMNNIKEPKAAVAYDSRHFSPEFAQKTAAVLAANGIKTYIFKEMRPTPELSFTIRHLQCTTGVVLTASHNPKEYNGYKVYWDDGAQIISPHDNGIIEEVRKIKTLDQVTEDDFDALLNKGMIEWLGEEIDDVFIDEIINLSINKESLSDNDLKIVFTPLHGTGSTVIPKALERLGIKDTIYVDEQMERDPDFSTVVYPNPEEEEALTLAINKAKETGAELVIATDPDADRMGIAVKNAKGDFEVLNGNLIGSILEYYILSEKKKNGTLPDNSAIVKTIVTTDLQDVIGESFNAKVYNVLTGFKHICSKIRRFEIDNSYKYVFGGEESYGYLTGDYTRDKDAVGATLMLAECAIVLKKQNKTILDLVDEIFEKYGCYIDELVTRKIAGLAGQKVILKIMEYFRSTPLPTIGNEEVVKTIDYDNQDVPDAKDSPFILPKSNVLQYYMKDGSRLTLRPSGTEPKIKFYFSTKAVDRAAATSKIKVFKDDFIARVDKIIEENS